MIGQFLGPRINLGNLSLRRTSRGKSYFGNGALAVCALYSGTIFCCARNGLCGSSGTGGLLM
ncbi:MAG: hypothetical protein QOF41_1853 [Methylobacteriaceae bacterium]|jgi:hypothetical protein|nr:hypothetical protein [Methylobacteriaceae bacterium]